MECLDFFKFSFSRMAFIFSKVPPSVDFGPLSFVLFIIVFPQMHGDPWLTTCI